MRLRAFLLAFLMMTAGAAQAQPHPAAKPGPAKPSAPVKPPTSKFTPPAFHITIATEAAFPPFNYLDRKGLPAGFEIESVINDDTLKSFPFLEKLTPTRMTEARDDRFFASINLGNRPFRAWWDDDGKNGNDFHVAYIVRAVTPGRFALPAVNVSDMYAPRIYGRTAMGTVTISPK